MVIEFIKEILMWYVWFGKKILPLVKYGGVILLGLVVLLSFAQNLPAGRQAFPIPGNFSSLVVMSGSMEPKIHVGAVAIVKPSEDIKTGDIITFRDPRDSTNLVTHRIVEENEGIFKTKGDANNTPDDWEVTKDNIAGKFLFSIPLLGYAVNFAKQPQGFLLLILFPAILIIVNEIGSIKNELVKAKGITKHKGMNSFILSSMKEKGTLVAIAVSAALLTFAFSSGRTWAFLSDTETSSGNTISVGVWDVAEGSVVLNEFLPNPSGDDNAPRPDGEWVELYNKSATEFDLAGWYLYDRDDVHELPITAVNSASYDSLGVLVDGNTTVIPASGFLLVYRDGDGDFSLNNDAGGDKVRLYNGELSGSGVVLVDSYEYLGPVADDKSFARIPDGSDNWVDPIPTPGRPNELELPEEEKIVHRFEPMNYSEEQEPAETEPEPLAETADDPAPDPLPDDPPESSPSAQPVSEPAIPESSESAQPKESDE